ncbi:hypothetical protein GCM10020331_093560 [Ectobacillus funiculus]
MRNQLSAFFQEDLGFFSHMSQPRVTTVDTNPAYPVAIQRLKEWGGYLNNSLCTSTSIQGIIRSVIEI